MDDGWDSGNEGDFSDPFGLGGYDYGGFVESPQPFDSGWNFGPGSDSYDYSGNDSGNYNWGDAEDRLDAGLSGGNLPGYGMGNRDTDYESPYGMGNRSGVESSDTNEAQRAADKAINDAQRSSRSGSGGGGSPSGGRNSGGGAPRNNSGTPLGALLNSALVNRPGGPPNNYGGSSRPGAYNGLPGSRVSNLPKKPGTNLDPKTADGKKNLILYAVVGIGLYYLLAKG